MTSERLGALASDAARSVQELSDKDALGRLWRGDHTLWQDDPTEVADRLGWLQAPTEVASKTAELARFCDEVRHDGLAHVLLLGMGGSSLFPEVLARSFGPAPGGLELTVLDTTDPGAILAVERALPLERTLVVASSKSGSTIETRSHLEHFWARIGRGRQFCVVTDPGSELEALAEERAFRRVWRADPNVGGRYSALTWFGLVPAALLGLDVEALLTGAEAVAAANRPGVEPGRATGLQLGATLAAAATAGHDKLTLVLPARLATFGLWLEQLLAESTGKDGRGILPVAGEALGPPSVYGKDRLFVAVAPEAADRDRLDELAAAGHPVVVLDLDGEGEHALGGQVMLWELATALAGAGLGINPFDQPNVAEAKAATNAVLASGLPPVDAVPVGELLSQVRPGDYVSLQAYVRPDDAALAAQLEAVRLRIRDAFGVATTVGYGPRFLHSTGQYHKGGPPTGVFLQAVGDDPEDVPIPGQPFGFSMLKHAQAAGDLQTLQHHGLRAGRVALDDLVSWQL